MMAFAFVNQDIRKKMNNVSAKMDTTILALINNVQNVLFLVDCVKIQSTVLLVSNKIKMFPKCANVIRGIMKQTKSVKNVTILV